jgi:hypothetical protein
MPACICLILYLGGLLLGTPKEVHGMTTRKTFDVQAFNDERFRNDWEFLNDHLAQIDREDGLAAACQSLHDQQLDSGVVRDALKEVKLYSVNHPTEPERWFSIQLNPRRRLRFEGAGRQELPPGRDWEHGGCLLCRHNVYLRQCGRQLGYDCELHGQPHTFYVNPFPLMPYHVTVVTANHIDQLGATTSLWEEVVAPLLDLAANLGPGWVAFFNAPGAGATIPRHRHGQAFRRRPGSVFPLEAAAGCEPGAGVRVVHDYPVPVLVITGDNLADVGSSVSAVTGGWLQTGPSATFNLIASGSREQMTAYLIPRHTARVPGMSGEVASVELLGELVFSTEEEQKLLDTGVVNYKYVEQLLASVRPPMIRRFLNSLGVTAGG